MAEVVPEALLELGQIHQGAGRPAAATQAYKRLLTLGAAPDVARARALWRLAHVYEAENYLVSARDAYLQIQTRYPRIKLPELGNRRPAGRAGIGRARPRAAGADRPGPSPGNGAAAPGAALACAVADRPQCPGSELPSGRLRGCNRAVRSRSRDQS